MQFRVTLREVEGADTGSTTYYGGHLLVNGQKYGLPDGANDRGNYLEEALEGAVRDQLGRVLTDEEIRAVYNVILPEDPKLGDIDEDERMFPGDDREKVFEIGEEPGGGEPNPAPEWVTLHAKPEWVRILRACFGICADDSPEDWIDRGFAYDDVRELSEWLNRASGE